MSIIQTIREKGAKISVILIALALLGFILTDYVAGKNRGGFGGGGSNTIGSVNGKKISFEEFDKKVKQQEDYMKQQGYPQGASTTQQAMESAWSQEVSTQLLSEEFGKLGMTVGKKELGDILYGPNAPDDLKKQFTDEATGQYNPIKAKQQIDQMLKKGTVEQKSSFNNYIVSLEQQRMGDKYTSLLANSTNFPRWFQEKQNADNSLMAKASFVRATYTDSMFVDSTIKISDKEIEDYISKHKDQFKQTESRSINYVSFSAAPSAADSAETRKKALDLKAKMDSTKDIVQMLASEGVNDYYDSYKSGVSIPTQAPVKDSLLKTPVGTVFGPYLEGANYMLAKMMGARQMPDTVKVRHILIATVQRDQQSGQMTQVRDDATAKKLIDSIQTAINNGSKFDSLVKLSEDDPEGENPQRGKYKGGIYDRVTASQMVAPFNDFIFTNPVGSKGVVKTEFGYHYIEILSQKGSSAAYKIAFLPVQIIASQETDNKANNDANLFAGDCRDQKTFDTSFEKNLKPKGLTKGIAIDIKPTDADVRGLGASRSFVKNIYAASRGDVLKPERVGEAYVVAIVTEVLEEGTQSVGKARPMAETPLRNKKKAELLKQKIGKVTTLEAAAAVLGGKKIETVDSLRINKNQPSLLSYEPKVIGAIFNAANKGKVVPEPIEGQGGVYVVRVENVSATAITDGNVAEQRKAAYQQAKQNAANPQSPNYPLNALRKAATIKDKRADKY